MQHPQARAGNDAEWYGLGWALRRSGGVSLIGHAGDTNGFRTRLTLVPTRRLAVVIPANSVESGPAIGALEARTLRAYCGLRAPHAAGARTTLRWARWRLRKARSSVAWTLHLAR
jgi:hypothetical protein